MMKKGHTRILYLVILIVILTISFIYGNYRIEKQRIIMQGEIDKATRKEDMLQRRYAEQKAISDRLQRMQISLEGQKNFIQAELTKVKAELASLQSEIQDTGKNYAECKEKYGNLLTENKGLKESLEEEKAGLRKIIKEHDEIVTKLTTESETRISELNAAVKALEGRLESCLKKNARLCIIAEELLDHYKNKGVMSAIMAKEPITQIEKVELEKLIQEYREEIGRQKEKKENN